MQWRIYYDDGSTFDSDDGTPADAPGWGVLVIVERNNRVGRLMHAMEDYYVFIDGSWISVDFVGMLDHVINKHVTAVKVGRMVENSLYRSVYERALNDPDFGAKSGWEQKEPRE